MEDKLSAVWSKYRTPIKMVAERSAEVWMELGATDSLAREAWSQAGHIQGGQQREPRLWLERAVILFPSPQ